MSKGYNSKRANLKCAHGLEESFEGNWMPTGFEFALLGSLRSAWLPPAAWLRSQPMTKIWGCTRIQVQADRTAQKSKWTLQIEGRQAGTNTGQAKRRFFFCHFYFWSCGISLIEFPFFQTDSFTSFYMCQWMSAKNSLFGFTQHFNEYAVKSFLVFAGVSVGVCQKLFPLDILMLWTCFIVVIFVS